MWMCVNWLYKGESLNCKGYTVNHVNVLCSSSMKFWCWKSAFSSCVAQAPSAMEAWEWGADDDGRWRWLPWHGPGSDGGSGLSVTKHNNCRANRVANRQNERDRLRANDMADVIFVSDLAFNGFPILLCHLGWLQRNFIRGPQIMVDLILYNL